MQGSEISAEDRVKDCKSQRPAAPTILTHLYALVYIHACAHTHIHKEAMNLEKNRGLGFREEK